jgi:hypothetical protein
MKLKKHRGRPFGPTFAYHREHGDVLFTDEQLLIEALESGEWGEAPYDIPEVADQQPDEDLKPWQKAQAARKAKKEAKGD